MIPPPTRISARVFFSATLRTVLSSRCRFAADDHGVEDGQFPVTPPEAILGGGELIAARRRRPAAENETESPFFSDPRSANSRHCKGSLLTASKCLVEAIRSPFETAGNRLRPEACCMVCCAIHVGQAGMKILSVMRYVKRVKNLQMCSALTS